MRLPHRVLQHCMVQCSAVLCCDVLPCTWVVLWWISAPSLLFVLLVHMCGVTHCSLRFRSAQTAHMGDVVVDESEWVKLHRELYDIVADARAVKSFMVKHVNTKWEV